MYIVSIRGVEKKVDAKGVAVENGNIIFFCDEECVHSKFVVATGKWDSIEVEGDSDPLQIKRPVPQEKKEPPEQKKV